MCLLFRQNLQVERNEGKEIIPCSVNRTSLSNSVYTLSGKYRFLWFLFLQLLQSETPRIEARIRCTYFQVVSRLELPSREGAAGNFVFSLSLSLFPLRWRLHNVVIYIHFLYSFSSFSKHPNSGNTRRNDEIAIVTVSGVWSYFFLYKSKRVRES